MMFVLDLQQLLTIPYRPLLQNLNTATGSRDNAPDALAANICPARTKSDRHRPHPDERRHQGRRPLHDRPDDMAPLKRMPH
jgi:hypothetical protein